jgi:hypothetical protein
MQITPVAEMLAPRGLQSPQLRALIPNENNYSAFLLQPHGNIIASADGVHHADRDLATTQFSGFLDDAVGFGAELAVAPEYSVPWQVLADSLRHGRVPAQGHLWALGCESIRYSELVALSAELAPHAELIFEPLVPDDNKFVDPLAYVFVADGATAGGNPRIVVLIQFKTSPMGGTQFEIAGLQRGTKIYIFGEGNNLRLVSIICSDALAFLDSHALAIYQRSLVLHLQLNKHPRQEQYRLYRDLLLKYEGDETELLCLNWAKDVTESGECWHNISGSAWYLRPDKFDHSDAQLTDNHRSGLYYTWFQSLRSNALFFNYEAASYLLTASKVAHFGVPGSLSLRSGPKVSRRRVFDEASRRWIDDPSAGDGFNTIIEECGGAAEDIRRVAEASPINAERLLALGAGAIGNTADWHSVKKLDSFGIDKSEIVMRVTCCQDSHPNAKRFRVARLKRCSRLREIVATGNMLPRALADLGNGFRFEWSPDSPHQNVVSQDNRRATVIYMGEEESAAQVEATAKRAAALLHRSFSDPDESLEARQRLAVWHRNATDAIELFDRTKYLKYDDSRSASEFDITRAT